MRYRVVMTKEAKSDLDEAVAYISESLENKNAARQLILEFENKIRFLAETPEMYEICENSRLRDLGYRKFIVKNYIVFYKIGKSENIVYIMRIIYGKRDYLKFL